ncbi:hypothetical protein BJ741DRAFT_694845 [Chytriomyces cf. hyalinus JEL632]|nr:hypothetical protein BJ741DRAFT_694845 [Chytriomyces cf. hyalinus JEL632]
MEYPVFRYKILALVTERETKYMRTMNEVMLKPDWWIKLKSPEIVERWKKKVEAGLFALGTDDANDWIDSGSEGSEDSCMHDSDTDSDCPGDNELFPHVPYSRFVKQSVRFMFEEREFIGANRLLETPNGGVISPTSSLGVNISDSVVPKGLLSKLNTQEAMIEADSLAKQKWHENSNSVLDLIHPSDYCLVYGVTKIRESAAQICGTEPAFRVDENGKVRIESYINNLNRRVHNDLYGTIAAVFEALVPMFEMTMGSFESHPFTRIISPTNNNCYQPNVFEWHEEMAWEAGIDEESDEYKDFMDSLWELRRPIHIPGLPKQSGAVYAETRGIDTMKLRGITLQVIVKMVTICLTPENPVYKGGNWHLEGMENEAIAATGIVYYSMSNITSSRLTFRNVFCTNNGSFYQYEQHDFAGLEKVFGFVSGRNSVNTQICGQVEARGNRAVVFPNFLHHKVEEFELEDKTKPGFRRILAFFLVHPDFQVPSTKTVAVQQREWVVEDLFAMVFKGKLPYEIVENIVGHLGSTFSATEAAVYAHELSEERSNTPTNGYASIQSIHLCEH